MDEEEETSQLNSQMYQALPAALQELTANQCGRKPPTRDTTVTKDAL